MLLTCVINYSVIHCADRCYSSNLSLWLHDMTIYSLFVVQCCSAALNCLSFFISCKQACYARHTSKFYIAFYGLPLHYVLPVFFACLHADGNIVVPVRFRPFNAANVSILNEWSYRQTFWTVWQGHHSSFLSRTAVTKIQREPPQRGH